MTDTAMDLTHAARLFHALSDATRLGGKMHDVIGALGTEQSKGRRLKIFGRCCG